MSDGVFPKARLDCPHKVAYQENVATADSLMVCSARKHQERDLLELIRNLETREEAGDVLAPSRKFLGVPALTFRPRFSVQRGFDVDEVAFTGIERDNVQFTLVPPIGPRTDLDITPDEVAVEVVPLTNEIFEMVAGH